VLSSLQRPVTDWKTDAEAAHASLSATALYVRGLPGSKRLRALLVFNDLYRSCRRIPQSGHMKSTEHRTFGH